MGSGRIAFAIVLIATFLGPRFAAGQQDSSSAQVRAIRIDGPIRLSGRLDDPHWQLASPVDCPYEFQPGENNPAKQQTFVRVLYDSSSVYFGFDCRDTKPSEIRAHVTDRDRIYQDDFAIVFIDTYGDNQRSYEFLVNPFGIQADLLRTGNNEDDSFDIVWYTSAAINDSGWTVEMTIPFKSLRFPAVEEQRWTVLLGRNYPRDSRYIFSWTPVDRNNPCLICQGRPLVGIRNIEATTSVEVLPYMLGSQAGALEKSDDPTSKFSDGAVRGRVGGGVRYSPSPALLIEGVVNPDFSQVESDAGQISVNTTFVLFYPEKRPFFLEGADLFQNQTNTFYSRTINNPLAALKVSGKVSGLSFGYLAASDRNTPFTIPGEEGSSVVSSSLESFSNTARLRYDLGKESFMGAMASGRILQDAYNYVGGIDWNYLCWGNYYFRGETFLSRTKEVNDTTLFSETRKFGSSGHDAAFNGESYDGYGMRASFEKNARDYSFGLSYQDYSPTFQAQSGFVTRSDWRQITLNQDYTLYPTNGWLDRADLTANIGLHFNDDGLRKERWAMLGGAVQMKSQVNISVGTFALNEEIFRGVFFPNIPRLYVNVDAKPAGGFSASLNIDFGRYIYRTDTPSLGYGHNVFSDFTIKPTGNLQIEFSYLRSRLSSVETGELYFDGYIARTGATYQFTSEFFLRAIGQYNSFNRTVDIFPLFSYKLNPFTIFYVGSTHTAEVFDPPYGLKQTARQFFVKLQYLWRS